MNKRDIEKGEVRSTHRAFSGVIRYIISAWKSSLRLSRHSCWKTTIPMWPSCRKHGGTNDNIKFSRLSSAYPTRVWWTNSRFSPNCTGQKAFTGYKQETHQAWLFLFKCTHLFCCDRDGTPILRHAKHVFIVLSGKCWLQPVTRAEAIGIKRSM